jgi:catechol 2,3-dioxygenase-like lactoylglutathione lyase family enzyme
MTAKFAYLGYVVEDLRRTIAFYRLLGLEIPDPEPGQEHVEITLPSGLRLAWDRLEMIRGLIPDWPTPTGQRGTPAFLCESPAEVDELFAAVTAAGYRGEAGPYDAPWGQRYATVVDPDGVWVDLYAWLPGRQPA